jgi:hypothetical protein
MSKILKSTFKHINTNDVKIFLKNKSVLFNHFDANRQLAPELYFYDENKIEPGYYNFEHDGLIFQNCWIEPFDKIEDEPIRYRCGSYYVYTNNL